LFGRASGRNYAAFLTHCTIGAHPLFTIGRARGDGTGLASAVTWQSIKQGGLSMNQDILAGKWKQMRGQVKQWWGKLTDDDLDRVDGAMDKLAGALQERYGWERDEVDREIKKHFEQYEPERPSRR
jgi:uncharacterized protein YjbJ (UPF0337 family)